MKALNHRFARIASFVGAASGHSLTFIVAVALVVIWLVTGPWFNYSDTWQLVINTSTTVITFLLLFIVQNTQTRNAAALHLKLDELLLAVRPAKTELALVDLENANDDVLKAAKAEFERRASKQERRRHDDGGAHE